MSYKNKYIKYKLKYLNLCNIIIGGSNHEKKQAFEVINGNDIKDKPEKQDKEDINLCYANVMSTEEEEILYQLIDIWNKVSEELDIKWSVCAGTYIGLKRNGGRIKWDDDFDITIMKKDLDKIPDIKKKMSEYNVSVSKFGYYNFMGHKLFFNDSRGKIKFEKYGWNWPFIDIFTVDNTKECNFLEDSEFPLQKVKFGKTHVFVYQNPSKNRNNVSDTKWMHEEFDNAYRHQIESFIAKRCDLRAISHK
tara:strand:+ start:1080 stop:1826 length:747 start_codon:yes stop_codon:yes gene_type:complete